MKRLLSIVLIGLFCTPLLGQISDRKEEEVIAQPISEEVLSALMVSCYVCHNPRVNEENIIAPPLVEVKYIYKNKYPDLRAFQAAITSFTMYPTNQKALLQGAVMEFGVMPDMPLDKDQVLQISEYIYQNDIEEPDWFAAYFEKKFGTKWVNQGTQ